MRFDVLVTEGLRRRMVEIARDFRKEPTASESLLWEELRSRRLNGYKFRRQQPIGAFIVDFYCDEAGLIVEVDGPIHAFQADADRERQRILEGLGLKVLRIPSRAVEEDMPVVLQTVGAHLSPQPLSLRERGLG